MSELLSLLNQKNKILQEFLDYISRHSFDETEEEIPNILSYVEQKQKYIDRLSGLETKIKALNNGGYKDVKAIENKNNELIKDIISLDKINLKTMNNLKEKLRSNLKNTKIQKKYNVSYGGYASMDIRGSRFDSKQ